MATNELGRVYASSLVEIGQAKNQLAALEEEMKFVADLMADDQDFRKFLLSPGISKDAKKDFLVKVFGGQLSETMLNFLRVLIDNDRQDVITDIHEAMSEIIDRLSNRMRATITTSHSLEASLKEKILSGLKDKYKKDIIMEEKIDAGILGGIIIRIGDLVIDGSLSKDLRNIKSNLLNSKVRSEAVYED